MVIIGILERIENLGNNNEKYIEAIKRFGGTPLLIGAYNTDLLSLCHGLVMTGGNTKEELDDIFIEFARNHQLPLLGICQGMQSMALYQTINSLIPVKNHHQGEGHQHEVFLKESRLRDILGTNQLKVNSYHYQTVEESKCFTIVGRSEDGVIEALENSSHPFQIGVQWHPERMIDYDIKNRKIFEKFIACSKKNTENL